MVFLVFFLHEGFEQLGVVPFEEEQRDEQNANEPQERVKPQQGVGDRRDLVLIDVGFDGLLGGLFVSVRAAGLRLSFAQLRLPDIMLHRQREEANDNGDHEEEGEVQENHDEVACVVRV